MLCNESNAPTITNFSVTGSDAPARRTKSVKSKYGLDVFTDLVQTGTTLLVATHDLALARHRFGRCIAVNGTITADGAPHDVLTSDVLDSTFGSAGRSR